MEKRSIKVKLIVLIAFIGAYIAPSYAAEISILGNIVWLFKL